MILSGQGASTVQEATNAELLVAVSIVETHPDASFESSGPALSSWLCAQAHLPQPAIKQTVFQIFGCAV